jgi:hypothetical protein
MTTTDKTVALTLFVLAAVAALLGYHIGGHGRSVRHAEVRHHVPERGRVVTVVFEDGTKLDIDANGN